MKLKWTFPPTGGGIAFGFNDSGQEHFKTNAWENAIREIIQNSLDAVKDPSKPVTITISTTTLPSSEIGARDLVRHMDKALERTREQGDSAGLRFYEKALKLLKRSKIDTLAIIDTNTTGLTTEKWDALVYQEGTPNKRGMAAAGGSFGIGKNAPYLVSGIKTVCYSTRYPDRAGRRENFISRCKIQSHQDPDNGEDLQHIGFGTKSKVVQGRNVPPTQGRDIYREFKLDDTGSGIFILGFEPLQSNWIAVAQKAIVCNFFAAIHEKKLRIQIEDQEITFETIDGIFEAIARKTPERHYYHLIRNPDTQTSVVDAEIGRFAVTLSVGADDYTNTIAYINRRGMLVTDAKRFGSNPFHTTIGANWAKYVAVIRATDDKTDEAIRELEPPNHRSIEYERIIGVKEREKTEAQLRLVRKKVATIINDAVRIDVDARETNLDELSDIMQAEHGARQNGSGTNTGSEDLHTHIIEPKHSGEAQLVVEVEQNGGGTGNNRSTGGTSSPSKIKPSAGSSSRFDKARVRRRGDKLRVAFTPRHADQTINFMLLPAGEELKNERTIRPSSAHIVSPTGAHVELKGAIMSVKPNGTKHIVLDLSVGKILEYTGYRLLECEVNK